MNRLFVLFLCIGLMILIPYTGLAEQYQDRLDQHLKQINKGISDGTLTPAEVQTLMDEQKIIEEMIKAANADAKLTNEEKKEINKALLTAESNIQNLRKNKDTVKKEVVPPPSPPLPSLSTLPKEFEPLIKRLENHQKKINKGTNKGSVTQAEAQALLDEQKKIEDMIRKAGADGVLTHTEKQEIDKALEEADKNIEKLKNNKDKVKK
ncbi:MAG: hypothetical protein NT096_04315 [Proteobacteria bacterium]|nr:hypothetical protein [Pseudomonadota bacterium]